MSDVLNLRKEITAFNKAERFDAYSKIIINVTDDLCYEAGNNTGRTLTISCPWGTQAMANNLLSQMRGFSYQPYTAEGAILNPASELGDGINVNGVYSGIYRIDTKFNSHCSADISAPFDEEINYEFPYKSKQEREVKRQNSKFSSQFTLHANQIKAEVEERKEQGKTLQAAITVESNRITQEVSERKAQDTSLSSKITQEAGRITQEISDRKSQDSVLSSKITQEAGRITQEISDRKSQDATLSSKITQESNRITQEVNDRKTAIGSVNSVLEQQAGQISAKVSKTGGSSSSFGWVLNESSWSLKSNGSDVLKATKNGLEIKGKITATGGTIGGFSINSNYISYNNQTWGGTNTTGIYIGTSGIQLGTKFKVDAGGNLYAYSGTFEGYVNAGSIRYGDEYGTFDGGGISYSSLSGSRLKEYTIDTSRVSSGISSSLGKAGSAYSVTHGGTQASTLSGATVYAGTLRVSNKLYLGGTQLYLKSTTIDGTSLRYVAW